MAIELDDFLEIVIAEAAETLQIQDPSTGAIVVNDPILIICAKMAYAHSIAYLRRSLIKGTFTEAYVDIEKRVSLKHTPVLSVTNVWDAEGTLLVVDTDYTVLGNELNLDPAAGLNLTARFNCQEAAGIKSAVVVEYVGGYVDIEANKDLESALVMQTVVNYNRKDHMGLQQVTGGTTSSRHGGQIKIGDTTTAESGRLFGGVKEILSPYVYYGDAYPITM